MYDNVDKWDSYGKAVKASQTATITLDTVTLVRTSLNVKVITRLIDIFRPDTWYDTYRTEEPSDSYLFAILGCVKDCVALDVYTSLVEYAVKTVEEIDRDYRNYSKSDLINDLRSGKRYTGGHVFTIESY